MIERIKNLSPREQLLVGGAVIFIICLVIYLFLITPALEKSKLLSRLITQKERDFTEFLLLRKEYQTLKASEDEIVTRLSTEGGNISPLTHLEQLAQKAGLREQIQQMKPLAPVTTPRCVVTPVQLLFKGAGPEYQVALSVLLPTVLLVSAFFVGAALLVVRAHTHRPRTGAEGLVNEIGIVKQVNGREGKVLVHGELWQAVFVAPVTVGTKVRVQSVENLVVTAVPLDAHGA